MKERMKNMKTDIQIAQEAEMSHIRDVAASIGIEEDNLELYCLLYTSSGKLWRYVCDRTSDQDCNCTGRIWRWISEKSV